MANKQEIIERLKKNLAEIITPEEFEQRLSSGQELTHYIGFEISGYVHIGQGMMTALVIKDLQDLGVKCTIWLADWHTFLNDKLDGKLETATRIGAGYFTEAIKASLQVAGADVEKIEFRLASDWYKKNMMEYWWIVMQVASNTTDSRIKRSIDIMGRAMGEDVEMSRLMYPAMQVADVFYQNIDIVHAGMDQRKAYVIMRQVSKKVAKDKPKPIALFQHLLPGLDRPNIEKKNTLSQAIQTKMSKSRPESAIFIHDSVEDIQRKIKGAYCPEIETVDNPVLSWTKHLLFWNRTTPFVIERKEEHGGTVEFETYEELEAAFGFGDIHPMDLKTAVTKEIIELLIPAREHFAKPEIAAKKLELDNVLQNR